MDEQILLERRVRELETAIAQLGEVRAWREKILLVVVAFLLGALLTGIAGWLPLHSRTLLLETKYVQVEKDVTVLWRKFFAPQYPGDQ